MQYKKKIILSTCSTLLFFGTIELILREIPTSLELAQSLFFHEFAISRWEFLSERSHQLNVNWVLDVIAQKNAHYQELPEPNRPSFDRIPEPYMITTNTLGFRDDEFPANSGASIVILGDSVAFGKGVEQNKRFSSILQEKYPHIPIYNLALQGCTMDCMATVLEKHIDRLKPHIIIVQTSSNDIDQTLWREGVQMNVPSHPVPFSLRLLQNSYLLQTINLYINETTIETLQYHSVLAENHYQKSLTNIFDVAKQHHSNIVSVNLPFAYTWNYGGHFENYCVSEKNCFTTTIHFPIETNETSYNTNSFARRTAEELHLSMETIQQVFPNPKYFLDVVHLTNEGHNVVAEQLEENIDLLLKKRQLTDRSRILSYD